MTLMSFMVGFTTTSCTLIFVLLYLKILLPFFEHIYYFNFLVR
jgi:hypothetical protein